MIHLSAVSWKDRYLAKERALSHFLMPHALSILRMAMGLIYFWYGMLKVVGMSPAEELVFNATHWIGVHNFVVFLGVWEIAIGICLWIKRWMRLGIILLLIQFPGTFLPLFLNPEDCFTSIPFGLTLEGQYIFKNLVFLAATLILITSLHKRPNT